MPERSRDAANHRLWRLRSRHLRCAIERKTDHLADAEGKPRQVLWRVYAKRAVLAAGAIERSIAFPNNDRPGVMLAGAVRAYANRFAATPGKRVAVFTNNDDGWRTAADLAAKGRRHFGDRRHAQHRTATRIRIAGAKVL